MIIYNDETDEAVREWLDLTDDGYEFYRNHRKPILEEIRNDALKLRSSGNLKHKIEKLASEAKSQKGKRNCGEILQYNVMIKFMEGGIKSYEVKEVAEMAGVSTPAIRQYKDSAYLDLKNHITSQEDQFIYSEFTEETQLLKKHDGKWLN